MTPFYFSFSVLFTRVTLWFQVSYYCSLWQLCVIFTEVAVLCFRCLTNSLWCWFLSCQVSHVDFCGCVLSFQMFHYHSLGWFCVIPTVSLLLTVVAPENFLCPTASHWYSKALLQAFHIFYLGSVFVIPGVSLLLTEVVLCHFRCLTLTLFWLCGSVVIGVPH